MSGLPPACRRPAVTRADHQLQPRSEHREAKREPDDGDHRRRNDDASRHEQRGPDQEPAHLSLLPLGRYTRRSGERRCDMLARLWKIRDRRFGGDYAVASGEPANEPRWRSFSGLLMARTVWTRSSAMSTVRATRARPS